MSIGVKFMTLILAIQDSVHRRANFAGGFVMNRTCTGSLQEHITCVGQCFPYSEPSLYLNIVMSRETHPCSALCSEKGICQIDTAPQSIQATFTGRHEAFVYTKVFRTIIRRPPTYSCCSIVYTRFVDVKLSRRVLTSNKLPNGCSAS
jgi:hypothetical protein